MRMKEREAEIARLRKAVAELMIDELILKDVACGWQTARVSGCDRYIGITCAAGTS
jgi:hypothetical protein